MIVVDSGVWVDYFTGNKTDEATTLNNLLGKRPIGTSELIYAEVLQGFKSDQDFDIAKKLFSLLTELDMVNPIIAVKSAVYSRHLKDIGISIRNTMDIMIATFCIENKYPLLYTSKNFKHFERHLKLQNALHPNG